MRDLFSDIIRRHKGLLAAIILIAIVLPVIELLSVGMVLPVLGSLLEPEASATLPGFLARWQALFDTIELGPKLWLLACAILVLAGVGFVGRFAFALLITQAHLLVNMHVKEAILDKIFTMDAAAVQRYRLADLHTYLGTHSNNAGDMAARLIRPLPAAFGLLVLSAVSLLISMAGTAMAAVLFVAVYFLLHRLHRAQASAGREHKERIKQANFEALDTLNGFRAIVAFSRESAFRTRLWRSFLALCQTHRRRQLLLNLTPGLITTLAYAGLAFILMGFLVVYGPSQSTILLFFTFFLIVARSLSYAQQIIAVRSQIAVTYPATQEIAEFLQEKSDHALPAGAVKAIAFNDCIRLEGVSFCYQPDEPFALRGLGFTVRRGERIGIVGPSGSGKSTLIDLMLKFHVPTAGAVSIDGVSSVDATHAGWRSLFGVVPQDAYLLSATVAENIRFGDESLTDAQVEAAAQAARVSDFLDELPDGLSTHVGDRGVRLSGGQRQRVAIARALANRRKVLIFDEATSALDSISENQVRQAIDALPESLTVFIVAHRLSTIANCDRVLVMEGGRIVEQGTPEALDRQGGMFHQLSQEQGIDWRAVHVGDADA